MISTKPKVLIVHPDARDLGGVASFFKILEPFRSVDAVHFVNGRRPDEKGFHLAVIRLVTDYFRYARTLMTEKFGVVHLNPSLNFRGVWRDAVFLFIGGHILRNTTLVFFHGWEVDFAASLKGWRLRLFCFIFKRADATVVLANDFKETLLGWGFQDDRVIVGTTAFEETLTGGFSLERAIAGRCSGTFDILFFARLIREKGIYETLDTFELLTRKYPEMRLLIAGDGEEYSRVQARVEQSGLHAAVMLGYIQAGQKKDLLARSSLFFLPSYSEGFPISLVEAMAVGLPIVTRSVGGITDFFVSRKHGFATESKDAGEFAAFIGELYECRDLYEEISRHNYTYAQEHFAGSMVRARIETIYRKISL